MPLLPGGGSLALQRTTGILFLLFAAAASWTLFNGSRSCGCFGAVEVPPSVTFGVDLAIAIVLLALPARSRATAFREVASGRLVARFAPRVLLPLAASAMLAVLGSNGSLARGVTHIASLWDQESVRLLMPEDWLGQAFPLAGETGLSAEIAHGKWTVLFYHRGCPQCESMLRSLARQNNRGVVIEVDAVEARTGSTAPPHVPSGWLHRELDPEQTWLVETPAVVELTNGVVRAVRRNAEEG